MLKPGMKVLDVGCAAGGFYSIMKEIEPDIFYSGCDVSKELLKIARSKYPDGIFFNSTAKFMPCADNSFDLVHSTGTLHMEEECLESIKEIYRVSSAFSIIDLRLTNLPISFDIDESDQRLIFEGEWDGKSVVPYVILNIEDLLFFLLNKLTPKPLAIYAKGYEHSPSPTAKIPLEKVCMTLIMLQKPDNAAYNGITELCFDIPYDLQNLNILRSEKWQDTSKIETLVRGKADELP
jgi:SAM-dependent methyltransferase